MAIALERLRGAVEGANLAAACAVYAAVMPCLPALLHVRRLFAAQPLLQQLLLQLATALAGSHSGTLHHDAAEVPPRSACCACCYHCDAGCCCSWTRIAKNAPAVCWQQTEIDL